MDSSYRPEHSRHIESLLQAIAQMPKNWALTPCVGKQNFWPQWNSKPLSREELIAAVRSQTNHEGKPTHWTGVSLVTGPMSGGLMAVDFDGSLALQKYLEFSGSQMPPTTQRWTSGKPGHFQILLSVSPEKWEGLKPQKIELENGEKLELRWNQCSTLPPSIHPDTQQPYFWKNQGAIASAPDWILDLMREAPAVELPKKATEKNTIYIDVEKSLVDILDQEILPRLDAVDFYQNWAALKASGKNFKGLCPFHPEKTASFTIDPDTKLFKCFGCGAGGGPVQFLHQIKGGTGSPTGKEFAEVVRELADRVGVRMPDFEPRSKTQHPKSNNQSSNLVRHPAAANYVEPSLADAAEIVEQSDRLRDSGVSPANEIIEAITSAKRFGITPKDFREILRERQQEEYLDFSFLESKEKFQQLYQIEKTQINLYEIFPPDLAKALLSKAESDRVDPVRILQSLLPVVGTVLGGRIGIELKKGYSVKDSHIEYPIFYTADIGHPSTGKSATQGTLVEPLQEMQDDEQERLNEALIELVQLEDVWKSMPKEERAEKAESDENPRVFQEKYCKPKKWLLDEASAQALTKRISEQAQYHGCLLLQDELAGLFDSMDQFTGGKGGQRQFLLKAWNKPLRGSVDRVDLNASYFFRSQTLSLTGTIQPAVARRIFNTAADPDGMLSRFLPAIASIPDNFAERPTIRVNVYGAIKSLIEGLQRLPETLLTLPAATAEIFWSHWENLRRGQDANFDSNPAYSYFLGKQISYVGRFAIVIHCLENLGAATLPTEISVEAMRKAVRLSTFYCSQFLLLQAKSAQQQPIEGVLLDILKFIRERGGRITTRELYHSRFKRVEIEGKKINAYLATKILNTIADSGYGIFYDKVFTLLEPVVPLGDRGGDKLNSFTGKVSTVFCPQTPKVYIPSEIPPSRDRPNPKGLIDEFDSLVEKNLGNLENIYFEDLGTKNPETFAQQGNTLSPPLSPSGTTGDKNIFEDSAVADFQKNCSQISENHQKLSALVENTAQEVLNEDEEDILEMMQRAILEHDCCLAQDILPILKNVCNSGAADRKKVWAALDAGKQKIFTALTKVVVPPEILEVLNAIGILLADGNSLEVDVLYSVFAPDLIDRAAGFLGASDKAKFSGWLAEKKLAEDMATAFYQPSVLRKLVADNSAEAVERAIARIEVDDRDIAEEIRDLLELTGGGGELPKKP